MIVENFINYLQIEKKYSKLTVGSYKSDLSQFFVYLGLGERDEAYQKFVPSDITAHDVRSWIMTMSEQKLKPSSINRKVSAVKSLYKFLYRKGYMPTNPMSLVATLKKSKTIPSFVRESQMNIVVKDILEYGEDYIKEKEDMILLLFYSTGIRLAELIALDVDDVYTSQMHIIVTGKGDKQRVIPIISILEKKLKNYLFLRHEICNSKEKSLFLSNRNVRISRSEVYRLVNRILKEMGVEGKKSPHVLRHTFATHLLGNGVGIESLKDLLGHSSLSATQIYTHSSITQLKEAYSKAHPRANNKFKI